MCIKTIILWIFGILSVICFSVECYEITTGVHILWSEQLHNLIDHIMYLVVNYIGYRFVSKEKGK